MPTISTAVTVPFKSARDYYISANGGSIILSTLTKTGDAVRFNEGTVGSGERMRFNGHSADGLLELIPSVANVTYQLKQVF